VTPCISIIVIVSIWFGVGHILIGMCINIFRDWTCGINKFGIVDQENSMEVIDVKMMYTICMFGTDNSGFLQLNPGVLIRSNSIEPKYG
jgi:vacuolar-type H+-ATPase subunit I/STV1